MDHNEHHRIFDIGYLRGPLMQTPEYRRHVENFEQSIPVQADRYPVFATLGVLTLGAAALTIEAGVAGVVIASNVARNSYERLQVARGRVFAASEIARASIESFVEVRGTFRNMKGKP